MRTRDLLIARFEGTIQRAIKNGNLVNFEKEFNFHSFINASQECTIITKKKLFYQRKYIFRSHTPKRKDWTGFFLLKDASAKLRNEPIKISVEIDRLGFLAETNT